jgi:cyclic pyranopterin monophosphate synthase
LAFQMINVADKPMTSRRSVAQGFIQFDAQTFDRVAKRTLPKGDALILAEVAGIQGAKMCSQLLPLCHPIELSSVTVSTRLLPNEFKVEVTAEASCFGKTGVEMEALSAVSAALLCLHDLTKMFDAFSVMSGICLVEKEGGKSGHWKRQTAKTPEKSNLQLPQILKDIRFSVLTVSDSGAQDVTLDKSGPKIREYIEHLGALVQRASVVADEIAQIQDFLGLALADSQCIVLTGGTGISERDVTPQAVKAFCDKNFGFEIQGIGELLRSRGAEQTPMSWISRSGAYCVGKSILFCFPGSARAVEQGLDLCVPLMAHMLAVRMGAKH